MENHSKNSLLGQLKQSGIISDSSNTGEGGFLPFGILTGSNEQSPFLNNEQVSDPIEKKPSKIVKKRLNELDANFFSETNFLNMDDDELTIDEKIKKIKSMLKKVDEKIYMLEDSDDEILLAKLKNEKDTLGETLNLLSTKNEKDDIETYLEADNSQNQLKEKVKKIEKIFFKICPILYRNFLVRRALNKLIMLNESAKELMAKKIPYGESESRYNDFTAYLNCANVIHAKLTKKI